MSSSGVHRILPVVNVLGLLQITFSLAYFMPITWSLIVSDGAVQYFVDAMIFGMSFGTAMWFFTRKFKRELQPRDGFLLVTLSWVLMAGIAAVPLMLAIDGLSFTDAFFETMSGLTTTGATVLTGLDKLPPSINLWRHELNWLGGMGIIVLAVAILPMLGVGGMQLYKAETPGPMKDAKLTARIADTAKALWLVYFGITVACIASLKVAGLSWLDAVCHAFATMALGGFSTYDDSIGHFNSPLVEFILIFFMLVAAMNFATHYLAFRQRSLRTYLADSEAVAVVIVIASSCFGVALYLRALGTYPDFLTALRHASFNLVSIATDCGFASVDFDKWPAFAPWWMLFLSCVAVSSGSTGGGIKMIRTLIFVRHGAREMLRLIHPAAIRLIHIGRMTIPDAVATSVLGFILLYLMSIVFMTFLLVFSGLDFVSSLSAIIACINNAGPGLNVVGPAQNYAPLSDFQTWVCAVTMLLGRLEVLSMVVLFTPYFWRN
ncbi:MAG: Trk system potassium uptake protein TrkH [Betaproteobacteria bacterium ADurb.Bin341]|nr:MAG: Trk system potassium uptake protein TrkH [Betaproteobacteria bacterium ADurb.Bin341]